MSLCGARTRVAGGGGADETSTNVRRCRKSSNCVVRPAARHGVDKGHRPISHFISFLILRSIQLKSLFFSSFHLAQYACLQVFPRRIATDHATYLDWWESPSPQRDRVRPSGRARVAATSAVACTVADPSGLIIPTFLFSFLSSSLVAL